MVGAYQSTVRRSTSGSGLPPPGKRSLATRLAFDDTMEEEDRSPSKITRLGNDPFNSALGSKRFASANSGAMAQIQEENESVKAQLRVLKAELAGAIASTASAESKVQKVELELRKEQLDREAEKARLLSEGRDDKEKVERLMLKMKRMSEQEKEQRMEDSLSRRQSIDRTHELEVKVRKLREEKDELEEEVSKVRGELWCRASISKDEWREEVQKSKLRVSELEQKLDVVSIEKQRLEERKEAGEAAVVELVRVKEELARASLNAERIQGELRANQEAVMQRQVMKDKLERFCDLERENVSLRKRNQLMADTAENSALMKEQVEQQKGEVERLEERVKEVDKLRADLEVALSAGKEWAEVVRGWWLTQDEREILGVEEVGVALAKEAVRKWQEKELQLVSRVAELGAREKELEEKLKEKEQMNESEKNDVAKIRAEQEEQTRLLKRLQRKLLLVTKERDSYKGVLDSYEKEVTLSGQEMDKERFAAQEKTLEEYKAMVDMLENNSAKPAPQQKELETRITDLEARNAALEQELKRRAVKGDFNPEETMVLHMANNPMQQALEKKEHDMLEMREERDALRTRVQLLEEGQTKDLTIMVGRKMEEGEHSEEISHMKEELEKAELRKQRLMEAFKKTSGDFREVVYQLTGYRIDVLADHKYRMTPLYAESSADHLLFQKAKSGEIQMLESEYSLELGELMELHLEKQNSIPMFLAGLIRHLWRRQSGEDEDENDEEDEEDYEMEGQEEQSETREEEEGGGSNASDAESDVICIDD